MITFGGCHSEYVHLNEMHVFDMTKFLENPGNQVNAISCNKVNITEGLPSTRWGHSASTFNDKVYILGGRNEQDVNDLFEFDYAQLRWR